MEETKGLRNVLGNLRTKGRSKTLSESATFLTSQSIQAVKRMDGPAAFAVFPPPLARHFFSMIGFRSDKKFYFMVYQGKLLDDAVSLELSSMASDERVKL